MRKNFPATQEQKKAIEELAALIGEQGYVICPVSDFFRRHNLDFLAYQKDKQNKFLIVRPTKRGRITITPFLLPSMYTDLKKKIASSIKRLPVQVRWSGQQLRFASQRPDWWDQYFPPETARPLDTVLH